MGADVKIKKLLDSLKKYRYSILILLIGLILMGIPINSNRTNGDTLPIIDESTEVELEERLSVALSQMQGAGKVDVVLTRAAGEEVIYQTNQDISNGDATNQVRSDTVTITDVDRNQSGLIRQVNPEQYLGAIILCQGADDPVICLAIVDAVSKATGLGANRISVLKMN